MVGARLAVAGCFLKRAGEAAAKPNAKWRVIVGAKEHQRVLPCIHREPHAVHHCVPGGVTAAQTGINGRHHPLAMPGRG